MSLIIQQKKASDKNFIHIYKNKNIVRKKGFEFHFSSMKS